MRLAIIAVLAAALLIGCTAEKAAMPDQIATPDQQVKEPVQTEPELTELQTVDDSINEAEQLQQELDFTELDQLDEELKELQELDLEP